MLMTKDADNIFGVRETKNCAFRRTLSYFLVTGVRKRCARYLVITMLDCFQSTESLRIEHGKTRILFTLGFVLRLFLQHCSKKTVRAVAGGG